MKKLLPIVLLSVLVIVSAIACGSGTPEEYYLQTDVNEGQGEIYPDSGIHYYPAGTQITVVAVPDDGWEFSHFNQADLDRDTGVERLYSNTIIVTLDRNKYVGVVFTGNDCSSGCRNSWIGDGYCDEGCYNEDCNYDGGDCPTPTITDAVLPTPRPTLGCADWFCGDTWIGGCCDTNGNGQYEREECDKGIVWRIGTGQITPDEACPTPTPTPN